MLLAHSPGAVPGLLGSKQAAHTWIAQPAAPRRVPSLAHHAFEARRRSGARCSVTSTQAELIHASRCKLGESPSWDERVQRLYYVDVNEHKVHVFDPATKEDYFIDCGEMTSAVMPSTNETQLVATLTRNVVVVDLDKRATTTVLATTPKEHGDKQWRFNDAKASPSGALILGRMFLDGPANEPGRLYSLDARRQHEGLATLLPSIPLPNGMTWDTKRKRMYQNETITQTVYVYETDDAGVPVREGAGKLKELHKLHIEEGNPDGLTIDADGNLWIALAKTDTIGCYNPDTGELLRKVSLPMPGASACTFGGPNLDQLFITMIADEGDQEQEECIKGGRGGLYVAHVEGVKGVAGAYKAALS
ncbi:hypothetical protein WJX73_001808 [Symbiochloris irregularis]|uniref:SMP-30/Gluconolactonase/LRE-like region domain-containing protein n=1 Tax=Symbiochloris irregularis TaxID=706552 RepID=A0AAW1PRI6_9CHLO